MNTVRVTNSLNPRGAAVGSEFDTDANTADRWVRRGWGAIVGIHDEQGAQSEHPEGSVLVGDGTGEALPLMPEPDADGVTRLTEPLESPGLVPARNRRKATEE